MHKELHSLKNCFAFFNRRLNLVIWRALSQQEKDKFKEDGPVQYMQHKEALLEALENLGWPISYEDVILLEDEILAAFTYIQQASDLQEAVKKETEKSSKSHISNNKKADWLSCCGKNNCIELQRLGEETVKSKSKRGQKVFVTHKSQKVIARSDVTGFYYPGTVIKNISSTCTLVDFSNGEARIVPVKFAIPVGGAVPCPHLQVGDHVFARTGTLTGNEYYAPAIVIATPKRVKMGDKLYTVLLFNNRKEHCVRSGLIKISQMKYAFSCRYIRMAQMVDYMTLNNCIHGQVTNARNWPQDVEEQLQRNVCFQLRAWFNSVKSAKPNSSSMLWAQAKREQGGFTGCKSQLAWSSSQIYFLPHRLDIFKMLTCCWMQEDSVVCPPASDEF
ncbi:hypothetical protein Q9233_013158 [Columba guinea]|nr:hypothetical protein Q9233_013158 [Columba guinea]